MYSIVFRRSVYGPCFGYHVSYSIEKGVSQGPLTVIEIFNPHMV